MVLPLIGLGNKRKRRIRHTAGSPLSRSTTQRRRKHEEHRSAIPRPDVRNIAIYGVVFGRWRELTPIKAYGVLLVPCRRRRHGNGVTFKLRDPGFRQMYQQSDVMSLQRSSQRAKKMPVYDGKPTKDQIGEVVKYPHAQNSSTHEYEFVFIIRTDAARLALRFFTYHRAFIFLGCLRDEPSRLVAPRSRSLYSFPRNLSDSRSILRYRPQLL